MLQALPGRARDEIKRYFHGKCLNVDGFVSHICSREFIERLQRCGSREEQECCFLHAFCSRVATEAEILNQVETIAAEIGQELDDEWASYCEGLALRWNTRLRVYGAPLAAEELTQRLSSFIRAELRAAALTALSSGGRPSVGDTVGKIGEAALLLLPLAVFGPAGLTVGIPIFVVVALAHFGDYAMSRLEDRRGDYQEAISGRLALLGNRVGGEFEQEVRQRITDLHIWQERSVRATATQLAKERVGLL
jgi:hypothetical protein